MDRHRDSTTRMFGTTGMVTFPGVSVSVPKMDTLDGVPVSTG